MDLSIIIPAYNEENIIRETLESVTLAKNYLEKHSNSKMEIIVVNNNSNDNTVLICEEFDVMIIDETVHNIARVRNTGAKFASGDVICFLDADSKVSKNMFLLIDECMKKDKYIGGGTKFKLDRRNLTFSLIFVASVFATHIIGLSGVLIYTRRDTFFKLGGFNDKYYAAEDIDFVIKMSKYGKANKKRFKNLYRAYVIKSSRKFKILKFKDLFMQGGLLLHKSLRENPEKCQQWYDDRKNHNI